MSINEEAFLLFRPFLQQYVFGIQVKFSLENDLSIFNMIMDSVYVSDQKNEKNDLKATCFTFDCSFYYIR